MYIGRRSIEHANSTSPWPGVLRPPLPAPGGEGCLFTPKLAFWSSGALAFPSQWPLAELQMHLREGRRCCRQGPPVGNQGEAEACEEPWGFAKGPEASEGAGPSSPGTGWGGSWALGGRLETGEQITSPSIPQSVTR